MLATGKESRNSGELFSESSCRNMMILAGMLVPNFTRHKMGRQGLWTTIQFLVLAAVAVSVVCACSTVPSANTSVISSPKQPLSHHDFLSVLQAEYPSASIQESGDGFEVVNPSGDVVLKAMPSKEMSGWSLRGKDEHVAKVSKRLFVIYTK